MWCRGGDHIHNCMRQQCRWRAQSLLSICVLPRCTVDGRPWSGPGHALSMAGAATCRLLPAAQRVDGHQGAAGAARCADACSSILLPVQLLRDVKAEGCSPQKCPETQSCTFHTLHTLLLPSWSPVSSCLLCCFERWPVAAAERLWRAGLGITISAGWVSSTWTAAVCDIPFLTMPPYLVLVAKTSAHMLLLPLLRQVPTAA